MEIAERTAMWRRERRVLQRVSRAAWRLEQAERERSCPSRYAPPRWLTRGYTISEGDEFLDERNAPLIAGDGQVDVRAPGGLAAKP